MNGLDDTVEVSIDLSPPAQPGSVDPAMLRRAMKFGSQCRFKFGNKPFKEVEAELRTAWLRREGTEWDWVRAAVRAGYDPESVED